MGRVVSALMIIGIVGAGVSLAIGYHWLGGGLIFGALLIGDIFRRKLDTFDLMDLAGTSSVDEQGSPSDPPTSHHEHVSSGHDDDASSE